MAFCSTCGAEYAGERSRCTSCGATLLAHPPEIVETGMEFVDRDIRLRRSLAGLIDLGVAAALVAAIFRLVVLRYTLRTRAVVLVIFFAAALIPGIYLLLRDSWRGKSFGKLLMGLSVVNVRHRRRGSIADSVLRNLVFGFAIVPVVGWVVTLVIAIIAGVAVLSGRTSRIGEGLTDARVVDDRTLEMQFVRLR